MSLEDQFQHAVAELAALEREVLKAGPESVVGLLEEPPELDVLAKVVVDGADVNAGLGRGIVFRLAANPVAVRPAWDP